MINRPYFFRTLHLSRSVFRGGTHTLFLCALILLVNACGGGNVKEDEDQYTSTQQAPQSEHAANAELTGKQQAEYEIALRLLEQKQYERAKKLLMKLSATAAAPAKIDANLALCHFKLANFTLASQSIATALTKNSESADTQNLAALISIETGNFPQAEKHLQAALKIDSEHVFAHYNMALLYDIYFQEIATAYQHYLKYLNLINYEDKDTVEWVEQLRYSVEAE